MTGSPLLYLARRSLANRVRVRLRRLREPRYLIGSVLGVAYFSFILFGRGNAGAGRGGFRMLTDGRAAVELGTSFILFVTAALAWILPGSRRPALAFTLAEVQHLFTAPIPRRQLVRYRVLRSQIAVLVGSAITTLFFRPAGLADGLIRFAGLILLMTTVNLHTTGVSLSRASHGARRQVPQLVVAAAVLVVIATVAVHWGDLIAAVNGGNIGAEIYRLGTTGPVGIVLWPFRALARLPLSDSPSTFVAALPWALGLLVLNYVWVLRTDVPFEEASAELSVKLANLRRRGPRAPGRPRSSTRTPFTLSAQGRVEVAILWKNLISLSRALSWTTLVRVVAIIIFMATMVSRGRGNTATVLAAGCLFLAGFTLMIGPHLARNDLRQDLTALATLKTWPIRGAALVRGEVLAPATLLTAIISIALVAAAVLSRDTSFPAAVVSRWSILIAALLVSPGLVLAQVLVHNGLAVAFPAWVSIGARPGGVDVVGQRLLVMLAVVLALMAAVVPAAFVAGAGGGLVYLVTGMTPVVLSGLLAGATLLVEAWIGSELIGAMLERSDISAIDAPES